MRIVFGLPRKTELRLKEGIRIVTIPGLLLAFVALGIATAYFLFEPTTLRVAVPADSLADQRLLRTAAELLLKQNAGIRLRILTLPDSQAVGAALQDGSADLAALRADNLVRSPFQTVILLRTDAIVIVASGAGKVKGAGDLASAVVGVVDPDKARAALDQILAFYKIPENSPPRIAVRQDEITTAFRDRRIDALVLSGPAASKEMADDISAASRGVKELKFIAIDEATGLSKSVPWLEKIDVDQGTFGGRPARPAEDLTTVGISTRLVATSKLNNDVVADLTRQFIALRGSLNAALPGYGLVAAPDTDDNSSFVIHPGVKSYVSGERTTIFDRYGDWLYLIAIVASGLASMVAATFGWFQNQRRQEAIANILKLEELFDDINEASTLKAFKAIESRADSIFRDALKRAAAGELGDTQILTVELAMTELRARLSLARGRSR